MNKILAGCSDSVIFMNDYNTAGLKMEAFQMFMKKATAIVLALVTCFGVNVLSFADDGYVEVVPPKYDDAVVFPERLSGGHDWRL